MPKDTTTSPPAPLSLGSVRRWRKRKVGRRVVIYLLLIPVVYCGVLFAAQRRIVFPGTAIEPRGGAPRGVELVTLPSDAGEAVGYYRPGDGVSADEPGPLLVYAHGNYELATDFPWMIERYTRQGVGVLVVEYRGYGGADGKPSQRGITDDFEAFVDAFTQRPEIDADRLIYHGRSLGGAVVASLTRRRPPAGLILESTFTSAAAMARRFAAPRFLLRDPFDTRAVLAEYPGPVLIVHGRGDVIIPIKHSEHNAAAARDATLRHYDMTHNDAWPMVFLDDIDVFLQAHGFTSSVGSTLPLGPEGG